MSSRIIIIPIIIAFAVLATLVTVAVVAVLKSSKRNRQTDFYNNYPNIPLQNPTSAENRFCQKCGKELVGAGVFCQSCGTRVKSATTEIQSVQPIAAQPFVNPPTGLNDGRYIGTEEREWARLKNVESRAKGAPKWIAIGIGLILVFFILFAIRSATYTQLNSSTTIEHAVFFIGGGAGSLLFGIILIVRLSVVRGKLKNMPDYGHRNGVITYEE